MVNRFQVMRLVAIRLRSSIAIFDQNLYRNLGQQEKLVFQAIFIDNDIKNNKICQLFMTFGPLFIIYKASIVVSNTIYISDKSLNPQIKNLSNKNVA